MKYFLLISIKIYWRLIPVKFRKQCIYKLSCSNYVYNNTKEFGFINGLKSLIFRIRNCNAHYKLISLNGSYFIITKQNITITETEMSDSLLIKIKHLQ